MENNEQRTPEWKEARRGSFTSSQINRLMAVKGLGVGADSYCFELAIDIVCGLDEADDFESYDMRRGTEWEPIAFEMFRDKMAAEFIEVTTCGYIPLNSNTGGSPDGLTSDSGVLEIKCPKRDKFFELVYSGIEAIDQKYIDQMQHAMWVNARKKCYFVNFYIYNGNPLLHVLIVPRDQARIDLIKTRIDQALPIRDMYVEKLLSNAQWL